MQILHGFHDDFSILYILSKAANQEKLWFFCFPVTSIFLPWTTFSVMCKVDQSVGRDGYIGNPWHIDIFRLGDIKELKDCHVGKMPRKSLPITWHKANALPNLS